MSELNDKNQAVVDEINAAATESLKEEAPVDAAEIASTRLYLYTPKFLTAVDKLSSNALRRVLKRLVTHPLNDKDYKPTSQGEADVFAVGNGLIEAKMVLIYEQYAKIAIEQYNNLPQGEETNE